MNFLHSWRPLEASFDQLKSFLDAETSKKTKTELGKCMISLLRF